MGYYMASFDLIDCNSERYQTMHDSVAKTFPRSCKILTTTYLINTSMNEDEITDWFKDKMTDKNKIRLCVVKYVAKQYWLSQSEKECIQRIHE